MKNKVLIYSLIIIAATFLAYFNSFNNQMLWDDENNIQRNTYIHDWSHLKDIFTKNAIEGARKGSNYYRPLLSITYAIDYLLWRLNPVGYHISNTIFHAICALLIFFLAKGALSPGTAFLTGLFFAVHPIHTEAVTYISGRADPLSATFLFLALFLFVRHRKTRPRFFYALSILSFLAAILSKESSSIFPLLLLVYLYFFDEIKKVDAKRLAPFFIISGIYLVLRLTVLDFSDTVPENLPQPFYYLPFYVRLCTFLKTIPVYLGLLSWPIGLHMERSVELASSIFEWQVFLGASLVIGLFVTGILIRKRSKLLLFAIIWFTVAIFPNSNLIPINDLIYEHWLYIPSVGFFMILSSIITSAALRKRFIISLFLICALFIFYFARTMLRNRDWRDPITLYLKTIPHKPDSARLYNNLAMAYSDRGKIDEAIVQYKKAIAVGDYYPQTHYNLANAYLEKGDFVMAMKELKRSLEIDEDFIYTHEKLATIYYQQGKFSLAAREAKKVLELEPGNKLAAVILRSVP